MKARREGGLLYTCGPNFVDIYTQRGVYHKFILARFKHSVNPKTCILTQNHILVSVWIDLTVRIYNIATGNLLSDFKIDFLPNQTILFYEQQQICVLDDSYLCVYCCLTGTLQYKITLLGSRDIDVYQKSPLLYVCSSDYIAAYNIKNGEIIAKGKFNHYSTVLKISPDGTSILAWLTDEKIYSFYKILNGSFVKICDCVDQGDRWAILSGEFVSITSNNEVIALDRDLNIVQFNSNGNKNIITNLCKFLSTKKIRQSQKWFHIEYSHLHSTLFFSQDYKVYIYHLTNNNLCLKNKFEFDGQVLHWWLSKCDNYCLVGCDDVICYYFDIKQNEIIKGRPQDLPLCCLNFE
jgi:WD40 repeat protein